MNLLDLIVLGLIVVVGVKAYQEWSDPAPRPTAPDDPFQVSIAESAPDGSSDESAEESTPDDPTEETLRTLAEGTSADADVYTGDVDPAEGVDGLGGDAGDVLDGVDDAPDFVVQDFPVYLAGVVAGADSLDGTLRERLEGYADLEGYTKLLVVPDEEARDAASELVEQAAVTVHVTTPSDLTDYI
ncbi:MAG: hypothetical protein ABEH90_06475 [Halolamina sp.]